MDTYIYKATNCYIINKQYFSKYKKNIFFVINPLITNKILYFFQICGINVNYLFIKNKITHKLQDYLIKI